jgi:hypothetical protein
MVHGWKLAKDLTDIDYDGTWVGSSRSGVGREAGNLTP